MIKEVSYQLILHWDPFIQSITLDVSHPVFYTRGDNSYHFILPHDNIIHRRGHGCSHSVIQTFISSSFQLKLPLPCVLLLLMSFLHCSTVGLNSQPTVYSILFSNASLHRYTYHLFKRIKLFVNNEFNSSVG